MRRFYIIILFTIVALGLRAQTFHFGTPTNPQGVSITADEVGLRIGDRRVIPVMGELHYSRVPQDEWRRELRKMRAGGVTIVSTYVFWNHHEGPRGQWDWSGNRDLRHFVQTAGEEGLMVMLRVGPFCHGEVYQGGMADWVVQQSLDDAAQYRLRSTATGFMEATRALYTEVFRQVEGLQWRDGGPIIGMQIENECRGPWPYYQALLDMARQIGFDLPLYTRTGWPRLNGPERYGQMLPLYGDYADGFWDRSLTDMLGEYPAAFTMKRSPLSAVIATETFSSAELEAGDAPTAVSQSDSLPGRYPYLTCELGGGMMPSYHRRIRMSGNEAFPLALCKVGSGSNLPGYYMYHGGTNPLSPLHTMAECQASAVTNYNDMPHITYDFQALLGEMGQLCGEGYHQTRWFHQFLADWGAELSAMPVDSLSEHYARRGCFVFRNDYVRLLHEDGLASVTPSGMQWGGLCITSDDLQPFARLDTLYFIILPGHDARVTINGRAYKMKPGKALRVKGKSLVALSREQARAAFVIDGRMCWARHGGILYATPQGIVEETWQPDATMEVKPLMIREADGLRQVGIGKQKVAEQPSDADFAQAAEWSLSLPTGISREQARDLFVEISYQGDCARVYADGLLVQDNFWNGRTMLVRMSDLLGHDVTLHILPLRRDAPIYLQSPERELKEAAPESGLLHLGDIRVMRRCYE